MRGPSSRAALGALAALAAIALTQPAVAATLACTAETGLDWYSNPQIALSADFDPEAGPPVLTVDLETGAWTDRFRNRDAIHRSGEMAVLQRPNAAMLADFVGWDAQNRLYVVIRVWVEGMPFMLADRFGDAFAGKCVPAP